ncbi:hypothetical protein ACWGJT_00585 [Streptomyces xantholiticus]
MRDVYAGSRYTTGTPALAIARDAARRHGGTRTVGRSASGGALFELTLPDATRGG